jgi:hypothetical protein
MYKSPAGNILVADERLDSRFLITAVRQGALCHSSQHSAAALSQHSKVEEQDTGKGG